MVFEFLNEIQQFDMLDFRYFDLHCDCLSRSRCNFKSRVWTAIHFTSISNF